MPLTDTQIRNAKAGPKERKLADGRGLYIAIVPSGSKLWRLKYRIHGKEKKLSLGAYPDVSLKRARRKCEDARRQLDLGIDPS